MPLVSPRIRIRRAWGLWLTGTMVCTHIAAKFPTNPTWAVAGRSRGRLEKLAAKLRKEYPDRVQPSQKMRSSHFKVVAPDVTQSLGEVIGRGGGGARCASAALSTQLMEKPSAEVPTLIRDWVANYHEQVKAKGVAGGGTTKF
ncbi:hypothetical protein N8I77_012274 [Diaporthe amygdali]|uniref:Uncharacterized protein n=1 Tax=Phomopsis amygdali TaxID=1214568 RepID=A0AAD9VX43_PHOAM|nr:hypothetical protein N8I77_012274 [Diaporthe amygdali]